MPKLSPEDQARVDHVLSQSIHRVPRKPFRPMLMMLLLVLVLAGLTAISYAVTLYYEFI